MLLLLLLLFSHVWLFMTPWTAAHQASLSFTISRTLLEFMSIWSGLLSSFDSPILLLSSIFPSLRVFSSESVLCSKWHQLWLSRHILKCLTEWVWEVCSMRWTWLWILAYEKVPAMGKAKKSIFLIEGKGLKVINSWAGI